MKKQVRTLQVNLSLAHAAWGDLSPTLLQGLEELTEKYGLSVALGDVQQMVRNTRGTASDCST